MIVLVLGLIAGAAGYLIGDYKRRPVLGAVLGFFLGLIGIAMIAIIPARKTSAGRHRSRRLTQTDPRATVPVGGRAACGLGPLGWRTSGRRLGRGGGLGSCRRGRRTARGVDVVGVGRIDRERRVLGERRRTQREPRRRRGVAEAGPAPVGARRPVLLGAVDEQVGRGHARLRRRGEGGAHRRARGDDQRVERLGDDDRRLDIVRALRRDGPAHRRGRDADAVGRDRLRDAARFAARVPVRVPRDHGRDRVGVVALRDLADRDRAARGRAEALRPAQRGGGRRAREDALRRAGHDGRALGAARSPRVLRDEPAHGQQPVPHEPDELGVSRHRRCGGRPHPRHRGAGVGLPAGSLSGADARRLRGHRRPRRRRGLRQHGRSVGVGVRGTAFATPLRSTPPT